MLEYLQIPHFCGGVTINIGPETTVRELTSFVRELRQEGYSLFVGKNLLPSNSPVVSGAPKSWQRVRVGKKYFLFRVYGAR